MPAGPSSRRLMVGATAVALAVAVVLGGYAALRSRPVSRGGRAASLPQAPSTAASPTSATTAPVVTVACPIQLREVTDEAGISWQHTDGSTGRRFIVEQMTAGLATFDFDGDGLIDIYFPNGAALPGAKYDAPPRHALYRNLGEWRFQDVTESAGVPCTAYGLGIGIGDYNHDGFPDIYLNNFGPNVLYRNNGDGTFADRTQEAGVERGELVGAGACFVDVDGDGLVDLYVGNYIALDCSRHRPHVIGGLPSYPSPTEYTPVPDTLYRNNGDGTFADISRESGIAAHAGRSMGMIVADYDNDGAPDVFVCNDVQENFLFHNDGRGHFQEVAQQVGAALNYNGQILANMAVDAADYNRDGWLDFYTTNYQHQLPMLLKNVGQGMLEDVAPTTNAGAGGFDYVNWGCGFVDFDNDGHVDLFVANGHTEDNIAERDPRTTYRTWNTVLWNTGGGRFLDVSADCGVRSMPVHAARGAAFDDLDNDGDVDVVVLNSRERPSVMRNLTREAGGSHHWLQLRLLGADIRDAIGTRVRVIAGDLVLTDELHSGRGYQSHWGTRLHFGLGTHQRVDRIEILWPRGRTEVVTDVAADQRLTVVEHAGAAR